MAELKLTEAETLCFDYGLDRERVEEGLAVKKMIEDTPTGVEVGT